MRLISVAYDLKPQYPFEPICARFLGFRLSLGARYRYSGGSLLKQEVGGRVRHWDQKPIDNDTSASVLGFTAACLVNCRV